MFAIEELDKFVENGLAALNLRQEPKELYEPIEYMISIGGKRLRPVFVLEAYKLFSGICGLKEGKQCEGT